ncbi:MAG: hypothetical protein DCF25_20155 [Leptolyngbya foveolarum]|uniref:NACHT domain-containing protein n=1 Tax=Leptolyngbya foveolarum TaxID=47253 RepID=A0A2W4TPC4_9CYAN|nr:MAG: hypothetical protein DCF25_20155 [Leptolyngbya foveolarum]
MTNLFSNQLNTLWLCLLQTQANKLKELSKVEQIIAFLDQVHWIAWGIAVFTVIALAVSAVAILSGNLDKIFSFVLKYFSKSEIELRDQQLSALRQDLLAQMQTNTAKRLSDSLHNLVKVDLQKEEQLYQVGRQKDTLVKIPPSPLQTLQNFVQRKVSLNQAGKEKKLVPSAESTYSLFYRHDVGKRLLIIGEPGAGKTTELLAVTQQLVEEAIKDESKPIPLIFELSSWQPGTSLTNWLEMQFNQSYGVSKKIVRQLVERLLEQSQLLLLLDGLDELGYTKQTECVEFLEHFLDKYRTLPIIVCCRREEYEQGGKQLRQLNSAIHIRAVAK